MQSHNTYRELHGVGDLIEDKSLDTQAQIYAEKLAETKKFEHSKTHYGENLGLKTFRPELGCACKLKAKK